MRSVLNEGMFSDLFAKIASDAAKRVAEKSKETRKGKYYMGGSISKYTKSLLMSFPVICDDQLSLDSAINISKANEKNIASMMEMLFASMSINGKQGFTGKDVISLFHRNIDTMPIDDYIDMANDYVNSYIRSEAGELLPRVKDFYIREAARDMVDKLKLPQKRFPISSFNETSINDYMTKENSGKVVVYEKTFNSDEAYKRLQQAADPRHTQIYDPTIDVSDREKFNYQKGQDSISNQRDDLKFAHQLDQDRIRNRRDRENDLYNRSQDDIINRRETGRDERDRRNDLYQRQNQLNQFNQKRILDSDFKKANELQPTMMVVNFNIIGDDNQSVIDRASFIAGIKCRLIATTSLDIAERLISSNKQRATFKDFIRATSGEIGFTKEFLLQIKQQKIDAKNDAKRGEAAKLWNTLKKRSIHNNYRKLSRDGNDASAITTLIVSQDTANYIKSSNKIDINLPKTAMNIMDSYNLLCIVIADDVNEVAKFMYDGNQYFESLSYSVLSKEANDKAVRRELNLIQQRRV